MALIPAEDLTTLQAAATVKDAADSAESIHEEQSVAYAINTAANSGEHRVRFSKPISAELQEKLETNGYTVYRDLSSVLPQYIIEGF